ncbi:titin-like isoform X1 [Temnothorax curvispinosus]|uniref:Titin-like isoform X1 n=1 Tax=Temnothorax curvispinosus TaxID=300111 RepID=A0A6J1PXF2_9HYME|nr:titin-like isoform X1 [Temnothorax curvispinosus]
MFQSSQIKTVKEWPNVTDGIFPRKKNDAEPRFPSGVISRDIQDEPERVIEETYVDKVPVNHDVRPEVKDIETEPIVPQEFPIIQEPAVVPTEKIADDIEEKIDLIEKEKLIQELIIVQEEKIIDRDEKKIDFVEEKELVEEPAIIPEEIVTPTEKVVDRNEKKIDFVEEDLVQEPTIIPEEAVTPTEKVVDRNEKKIDFVEEDLVQEPTIIPEEAVTPTAKVVDRDEEKIELITEEKLDEEPVEKEIVIPAEKIADRNDEKVDFVEEEDSVLEKIAAEPVQEVPIAIEEPEIIEDEIKLAPTTKIELEPSRELEEDFEPEERMEYGEEEESITDYEKFIDEELQESLPAVIAREIPEEPKAVRREISRNAATLYERIDRERPVRPAEEREAVTAMPEERPAEEEVSARRALENSTITEQIISREPAEDACEETCPVVKEQKGKQLAYFQGILNAVISRIVLIFPSLYLCLHRNRIYVYQFAFHKSRFVPIAERIMRKLKARQRVIDHYYLTKGFSYFEDVCTCSLACMVYTLSRDPFVKSIFASLALFAVGLKLCSELDAWEMPSRVS